MFSSLVSWRTNRANRRLVASSIMAIRYSFSPRRVGGAPTTARKGRAGRVVDHGDQVQLLSPPLQPVVLAGVPLHQFSIAAPPRPPNVHLLQLLFLGPPQLPLDHPLPHRLFARLDPLCFPQIFRRQRWPRSEEHT